MLLRIRKYLCPGCGGVVLVKAKTKTFRSFCPDTQVGGRLVRMKLVNQPKVESKRVA